MWCGGRRAGRAGRGEPRGCRGARSFATGVLPVGPGPDTPAASYCGEAAQLLPGSPAAFLLRPFPRAARRAIIFRPLCPSRSRRVWMGRKR